MADNKQLLGQIGKLIDQKLEPVKKDLQDVKQGQVETNERLSKLEDGQAHTITAVEAVTAGQKDLQETVAKEADLLDFHADVGKKIKDHESRIEELEKDADIPHPHKN